MATRLSNGTTSSGIVFPEVAVGILHSAPELEGQARDGSFVHVTADLSIQPDRTLCVETIRPVSTVPLGGVSTLNAPTTARMLDVNHVELRADHDANQHPRQLHIGPGMGAASTLQSLDVGGGLGTSLVFVDNQTRVVATHASGNIALARTVFCVDGAVDAPAAATVCGILNAERAVHTPAIHPPSDSTGLQLGPLVVCPLPPADGNNALLTVSRSSVPETNYHPRLALCGGMIVSDTDVEVRTPLATAQGPMVLRSATDARGLAGLEVRTLGDTPLVNILSVRDTRAVVDSQCGPLELAAKGVVSVRMDGARVSMCRPLSVPQDLCFGNDQGTGGRQVFRSIAWCRPETASAASLIKPVTWEIGEDNLAVHLMGIGRFMRASESVFALDVAGPDVGVCESPTKVLRLNGGLWVNAGAKRAALSPAWRLDVDHIYPNDEEAGMSLTGMLFKHGRFVQSAGDVLQLQLPVDESADRPAHVSASIWLERDNSRKARAVAGCPVAVDAITPRHSARGLSLGSIHIGETRGNRRTTTLRSLAGVTQVKLFNAATLRPQTGNLEVQGEVVTRSVVGAAPLGSNTRLRLNGDLCVWRHGEFGSDSVEHGVTIRGKAANGQSVRLAEFSKDRTVIGAGGTSHTIVLQGNIDMQGALTTITSQNLVIRDKLVQVAKSVRNEREACGAGLQVVVPGGGPSCRTRAPPSTKSLLYRRHLTNAPELGVWEFSHGLRVGEDKTRSTLWVDRIRARTPNGAVRIEGKVEFADSADTTGRNRFVMLSAINMPTDRASRILINQNVYQALPLAGDVMPPNMPGLYFWAFEDYKLVGVSIACSRSGCRFLLTVLGADGRPAHGTDAALELQAQSINPDEHCPLHHNGDEGDAGDGEGAQGETVEGAHEGVVFYAAKVTPGLELRRETPYLFMLTQTEPLTEDSELRLNIAGFIKLVEHL